MSDDTKSKAKELPSLQEIALRMNEAINDKDLKPFARSELIDQLKALSATVKLAKDEQDEEGDENDKVESIVVTFVSPDTPEQAKRLADIDGELDKREAQDRQGNA